MAEKSRNMLRPMPTDPPTFLTLSNEEFERLTGNERLDYINRAMDALNKDFQKTEALVKLVKQGH